LGPTYDDRKLKANYYAFHGEEAPPTRDGRIYNDLR
jgi:hypothetical protein